jgi:hypothetical protein
MKWQPIAEVPDDGIVMIARWLDDGFWDFEIVELEEGDFLFDDGMCMSKGLGVMMYPYFLPITPPRPQ